MPISVTCACGKAYHFKDEFAGRRAKCSACGQVVVIPGQHVQPGSSQPLRVRPKTVMVSGRVGNK
jgi:hypothetical protein